jgi:hypothetical protein
MWQHFWRALAVSSEIESKLAGMQLAIAVKNQQKAPEIDLSEVKNLLLTLQAAVSAKSSGGAINIAEASFDPSALVNVLSDIKAALHDLSEKDNSIDFSPLAKAIDSIYQAMPEYDLGEITTAIQDSPDVRPELQAIAKAITENTVALRENTAAIKAQTDLMALDKFIAYDSEGKITKVSVK